MINKDVINFTFMNLIEPWLCTFALTDTIGTRDDFFCIFL